MPLPTDHPLLRRVLDLGMDAEDAGYPNLANALLLIARGADLPTLTAQRLVNTSTMIFETVEYTRKH